MIRHENIEPVYSVKRLSSTGFSFFSYIFRVELHVWLQSKYLEKACL